MMMMKRKVAVAAAGTILALFGGASVAQAATPPAQPTLKTVTYKCPWGNVKITTTTQAHSIIQPTYAKYGCTVLP